MQVLARPGMPRLDKVVGWTAQLVEQGWPLIQVIAQAIVDAPGHRLDQAAIDRIVRPRLMWRSPRWPSINEGGLMPAADGTAH